jgi:hypothetical protein
VEHAPLWALWFFVLNKLLSQKKKLRPTVHESMTVEGVKLYVDLDGPSRIDRATSSRPSLECVETV